MIENESEVIRKETGVYASKDGTPIYYELRGEGQPVVFVYGIACLINHWHHQINEFSGSMRTLAYDLRGHHRSNPIQDPSTLTMSCLGEDLVALLKHLNLPAAHVVGHSFGTPVMLEAYRQSPTSFRSLCFINGFAKNPIKGMFGLDVVEPFFYYLKSTYEQNPDVWNTLWKMAVNNPVSMRLAALAGGFNLHLTHFKDIEVYSRGVAQMDLRIFLRLFEELMRFDGEPLLPTIEVPTLIISGEDDRVTPKKFQEQFRELIPKNEFLTVPYGSHCTQLDFPDFVNLKLKDFWSRT